MKKSVVQAVANVRPETAPFTQVFKAEDLGEIWLLRIGPALRNEYLFKLQIQTEHPWNKKIMLTRKDVAPDRSDWHFRQSNGEKYIVFLMKKVMGQSYFEAFIEGRKTSIKAQLDEIKSRRIDPNHFIDEYLESLAQQSKMPQSKKAS